MPLDQDIPKIEGYEITQALGSGGMGTVYLAVQKSLDRTVAIKVLKTRKDNNPQFIERFVGEAKLLAQLQHPNVVGVFDAGQANGAPYIVMELAPGGSLKERTRLTETEVLEIIEQITDGLDYLHKKGVIHRDIKPDNVFFDELGRAKLGDLGIAKKINETESASSTQQGMIVGSPPYMSPEQVQGQRVDARSDLYSLGIVLYEMLNGQPPFVGEPMSVLMAHVQEDQIPAPLTGHERLQPLVSKLLEKLPEDRFQSAAELRAELNVLLGRGASGLTPRNKWALIGTVGTAVAITIGALWWAANRDPSVVTEAAIRVAPDDVAIFDMSTGSQLPDALQLRWEAGTYRWAFLKTDHIGEAKSVRVEPGAEVAINLKLSPLLVPNAADYARFIYGSPNFQGEPLTQLPLRRLQALREHAAATVSEADKSEEISGYQFLADHSDTLAAVLMGEAYDTGYGVPKDTAKARQYMTQAAATGYPLAQYQLSRLLRSLEDEPGAVEEGIAQLRAAADAGFAPAQYELVSFVPPEEQLTWVKRSAAAGFPLAQLLLAEHYAPTKQFQGCAQSLAGSVRVFNDQLITGGQADLALSEDLLRLLARTDLPDHRCP